MSHVVLYHPSGARVKLDLFGTVTAESAKELAASLFRDATAMLEVGFLVNAPGLEVGEQVEEVGYVVRGNKDNDDSVTPYILLYSANDRLGYSFLKVYLNSDSDITAFQSASGLVLQSIPTYIGQDKPKRGASKQIDRFIVKVPRPFKVALKKNPQYDEAAAAAAKAKNENYIKPARLFVRWISEGSAKNVQAANPEPAIPTFDAVGELANWRRFLLDDPAIETVTKRVLAMASIKGYLAAIGPAVEEWKAATGVWWNSETKSFCPPKDETAEADNERQDFVPF